MLFDLVVVVVAAVGLVAVVAVIAQRRRIPRGLGTFPCRLRLPDSDGAGARWRTGTARLDTDTLRWIPTAMMLGSGSVVLDRGELDLQGRWTSAADDDAPHGLSVLRGSARGRAVELAVPAQSAAAVVLWVESGPPGRGVDVV